LELKIGEPITPPPGNVRSSHSSLDRQTDGRTDGRTDEQDVTPVGVSDMRALEFAVKRVMIKLL